ncbi:MAG TPA: hypothetical protein VFE47_01465 [Tepidisphaeraceae bacterium]|jgi:hypothetical protein|nr:hypothetical protein [Tepidisphaeraceae bacterium]
MSTTPFDPFSRPAFYAEPDAEDAMTAAAGCALEIAHREFNAGLDFSISSVAVLDEMVDQLHRRHAATPFSAGELAHYVQSLGSYLGEVIRREHGGVWGIFRVFSDTMPAVQIGTAPATVACRPMTEVWVRITRGTGESLEGLYQRLVLGLAARENPAGSAKSAVIKPREFYRLRHDNGYFDAGTTGDGRQVLMSHFVNGVTAIFFDERGTLLEVQVRPLSVECPTDPVTGIARLSEEFEAAAEQQLSEWKTELGFIPQPITVRKFQISELGLGIEERPSHYEDFLESPETEEPDADEREPIWASIREWEEAGDFVLYWGNDLYVNRDGKVTSS